MKQVENLAMMPGHRTAHYKLECQVMIERSFEAGLTEHYVNEFDREDV
jgi:hypothetical protein